MNNPNNLFNMMQTGGLTSTAGGTALARAFQRKRDIERLEEIQRKEAERQKKGSLFGSIGSLAGGLLGAALSPFTGGLSLALASGLGAGLGRRAGEGLGAGKSRKYDREGTVFGQQAFRDVEQASRDYTRGMGERALTSGLQTALSAYLNPTGMYGKVQGRLVPRVPNAVTPDTSLMDAYFSENLPDPSVDSVFTGKISPENMGGSFKGVTPKGYDRMASREFFKIDDAIQSEMSELLSEQVAPMSLKDKLSYGIQDIKALGLPRVLGLGGKSFAENVRKQAELDNAGLLMGQDIDEFAFLDDVQEQPNMQASLLGLRDKVNQYNNPLGFQDGGYTAKAILQEAGFAPSEKQLGMFKQFDPGEIERAKERTEQGLLSMTGGMGLSSVGGGFGARQRAATSAIGAGQDLIGETAEQAQRDFESQTLGTMADLVTQEVEFKTLAPSQQSFEQLYGVSPDNQTQIDEVNQFLQTYQGVDEININGNLHQWNPYSNPPAYRPV